MCVQTQLQDQDTRITALESQHNPPEDLAAVKAEMKTIRMFLFGSDQAPDVQRNKSGLVKS